MRKVNKEDKRLYDIEYRRKNGEKIKRLKAERYQRDKHKYADREKAYRRKPEVKIRHNEYCRQPEYVKKKRIWDIVYRSMEEYGDFWESAVIVTQIEKEIRKLIPRNERLYYRRNVNNATYRNNKRRLEKAIEKIRNGEVGLEILRSSWIEESKQILEIELIKNGHIN